MSYIQPEEVLLIELPLVEMFAVLVGLLLNPLHAKFYRGNINIYLHFVSFLHIDIMQVVDIFPQIRQEPTYST